MKTTRSLLASIVALSGALAVLGGCGGVKSYRSTLPPNVHFRTVVTTGSVFRSGAAAVDIYRSLADCKLEHLGRLLLDKPIVDAGLPTGDALYIEFILGSKTFMSTSASAIRYDTELTLRPGYEYDMQLRFLPHTYSLEMRELRKGGGAGRGIERKSGSDCGKQKKG